MGPHHHEEVVIDGVLFPTRNILLPRATPKGRLVAGWEAMLQNLRSIPDIGAFKSQPSKAEEAPEQGSAHRSPWSNSGLHLFL